MIHVSLSRNKCTKRAAVENRIFKKVGRKKEKGRRGSQLVYADMTRACVKCSLQELLLAKERESGAISGWQVSFARSFYILFSFSRRSLTALNCHQTVAQQNDQFVPSKPNVSIQEDEQSTTTTRKNIYIEKRNQDSRGILCVCRQLTLSSFLFFRYIIITPLLRSLFFPTHFVCVSTATKSSLNSSPIQHPSIH